MRAMGWAGLGAAVLFGCGQSKAPADTGSGGPSTHALTIRTGGSGSGTVRSSSPAFDCGTQCTESIAANAKVQLRAVPAPGSTFAGWQGECSGTGDCTLTMDTDRDVTATFSTSGPPPTGRITVAFPFTVPEPPVPLALIPQFQESPSLIFRAARRILITCSPW